MIFPDPDPTFQVISGSASDSKTRSNEKISNVLNRVKARLLKIFEAFFEECNQPINHDLTISKHKIGCGHRLTKLLLDCCALNISVTFSHCNTSTLTCDTQSKILIRLGSFNGVAIDNFVNQQWIELFLSFLQQAFKRV
jgi:hypothetical protein